MTDEEESLSQIMMIWIDYMTFLLHLTMNYLGGAQFRKAGQQTQGLIAPLVG
jgi:hypothetical protein